MSLSVNKFFGATFYQRQHAIKMGGSFSGCVAEFEESHQSPPWADPASGIAGGHT